MIAENVELDITNNMTITKYCLDNSIDLVIVGPEAPLCNSLADTLSESGIPCFGPVGRLANLEGSKLHAKTIMQHVGVPTAEFMLYLILDQILILR